MAGINYLNSIDLGKINRWENVKAAAITPISFPGEDANKTEGVDTLGVIAYYNIAGRIVGTFEELQNTIYNIRSILDGQQTSAANLRSPFVNGKLGASSTRIQGHIGSNTTATANKLIDSAANFQSWNTTTSDRIKDLTSGTIYYIGAIDSESTLSVTDSVGSPADPFTSTGMPYAVTGTMNVKLLSFNATWGLPGLNTVNYTLSVMQVL